MRTFAFIPGQGNKSYDWIITKYKRQDVFFEFLKVAALLVFLLICGFFFLYYINLSSTRGYFLKRENQEINAVTFKYEILKTRLLDYKQQNRNSIQSSTFKRDVVDVSAEIVKIPNGIQLWFFPNQWIVNN